MGEESFIDTLPMKNMETVFPRCRSILKPAIWYRIIKSIPENTTPEAFPNLLNDRMDIGIQAFLPELAQLEWNIYDTKHGHIKIPDDVDQILVNPTLKLRQYSWKNLVSILNGEDNNTLQKDESGMEFVLIWQHPVTAESNVEVASQLDLLILKMVVEDIEPQEITNAGGFRPIELNDAVDRAVDKGILLAPKTQIRRDTNNLPQGIELPQSLLNATVFTLQWHITQACDLHCKHCYDRSKRSPLQLEQGIRILDDLADFCNSQNVRGQVAFTGGNPLLYPHFFELYSEASQRGFHIIILGNPATRVQIEKLISIQVPIYFQVSLEGLPKHNDSIRGTGHFNRTMEFLDLLNDLGVSSRVMLTLTQDNMHQVLSLAEMLNGLTDQFEFNRLSTVGEAADLVLPNPKEFAAFLKSYWQAAANNPIIRLKDNLFNILLYKAGMPVGGGCTGHGCGVGFNFLILLADGEVHACRKFPSLIGNIHKQRISEIYDSIITSRYRSGPLACKSCAIRPVCGGCLAVAHSYGVNIFKDRDPYCFMSA
jgi:selenobiotic family peptide radical SAM maturase